MRSSELLRALLCSMLLSFAVAGRAAAIHRTGSKHTSHVRGANNHIPSLRHRQLLHPMHHGHGGTSYLGCLNYTNSELQEEWNFQGDAPSCSYTSYGNYGDDDDDDNNNGDDDDNGGGDDDQAEDRNGDENDDAKADQDDEYAADMDDDMYGGNKNGDDDQGNGNDGRNGGNDGGNRYDGGYDVNNEDIADGAYDGNENPMESFNITQCSTYENLWVWDLAFSCDSDVALDNCECTFTEKLMDAEMITCNDIELCPKECPVCETCFKLVGCVPVPDLFEKNGTTASTFFAICAAIGLFLFGIGYYFCRHSGDKDGNALEENLIEKDIQDAANKIPPAEDAVGEGYDPEDIPDFRSDLSSLDSRTVYTFDQGQPEESLLPPPETQNVPDQINLSEARPKAEIQPGPAIAASGKCAETTGSTAEEATDFGASKDVATESLPQLQDHEALASANIALYQPPHPVTQESNTGGTGIVQRKPVPAAAPENSQQPSIEEAAANPNGEPPKADTSSQKPSPAPNQTPRIEHPVTDGPSATTIAPIVPIITSNNATEQQKSSPDVLANTTSNSTRVTPFVLSARTKPMEMSEGEGGSQEQAPDVLSPTSEQPSETSNADTKTSSPIKEDGLKENQPEEITLAGESNAVAEDRIDEAVIGATDKPSDASDVAPSEGTETPWIGDIDLSYTEPSFEEALEDEEEEKKKEGNEDIVQISADVESDSNKEDTAPWAEKEKEVDDEYPDDEPNSVWLAPIDDLEAPSDEGGDEQQPCSKTPGIHATETATTHQVEADLEPAESEVWLAPTSSPAELAPEDKDDDSSTSSWSPDNSGPWLAPL